MKTEVRIELSNKPSSSKGWARYRLSGPDGKVVESKTGNAWVSSTKVGTVEHGSDLVLTLQVMLRVGRPAREEVTTEVHSLVAWEGAACVAELRPGSQGMLVRIHGAMRRAADRVGSAAQ